MKTPASADAAAKLPVRRADSAELTSNPRAPHHPDRAVGVGDPAYGVGIDGVARDGRVEGPDPARDERRLRQVRAGAKPELEIRDDVLGHVLDQKTTIVSGRVVTVFAKYWPVNVACGLAPSTRFAFGAYTEPANPVSRNASAVPK